MGKRVGCESGIESGGGMGILAAFPVGGPSEGHICYCCKAVVGRNVRVFDRRHFAEERIRASSLCVSIKVLSQPLPGCEERFLFATGGERCERTVMNNQFCICIALLAFGLCFPANGEREVGLFQVTQYSFKNRLFSTSEAKSAINSHSDWNTSPTTKSYNTLAFSHNFNLHDADTPIHFPNYMGSFPANLVGIGSFALTIRGIINIPEAGNWTFACGSDDGFKATISGHGFSETFSYSSDRPFATSLVTFRIPTAGNYTLNMLYFNKGNVHGADYPDNCAALEFSMAKGSYSSFDSSAFALVQAATGPEVHEVRFDANGGVGEMDEQLCIAGEKLVLPKNTFSMEGYRFAGWAKSENGPVVYADGAEVPVTKDMTLYAVWRRIFRVRLHGNGATTEEGLEWVDLEGETWKSVRFPENLFTEGKRLKGDLSGWLKGWWPVTGVYDGAENKGTDLWRGISLKEEDIEEWKAKGWMEDIDGVPTVHFYAVWKSEVLVGVHGAYGKDLEPKELESVVKYYVAYNHYYADYDSNDEGWRTGVGTYPVLPGEQRVVVDMESGFGEFYTVTLLKQEGYDLQEVAPVSDGGWIYDISSTEGPQKIYLQIRVEPKEEEMGSLWFKFSPEMTDAQRAASWGEKLPDFDEGKVQIRVRPAGQTGNGMTVGKSVALPEGKYQVEIKYTEMAGEEKPYWDTTPREREIEVRAGESTGFNVVFRPFGSKDADYFWIAFDGDGGTVKGDRLMWFTPYEYLIGFHFPSAVRAGGWKFEGWWYPPQGKLVKTWRELDRLMRSDLPGNLTLKAQWKREENAATGTGTVVPHEWLESVASATLAAVGGDYEAAAAATAANGMGVWECYVAGLDPEDKDASFKAELVQEKEKWKAKPVGGEKAGRVYRVEGKRGMADTEEWTDVTDVEDVEAEGWRFFRVGGELEE